MALRCREAVRRYAANVLALLLAVAPAGAGAQADGIKLGDGRLHPSFDSEAHQVQNPGMLPGAEVGAFYFVGRGKAAFELARDQLELKLMGELEYRQYTGADGVQTLSAPVGSLSAVIEVNKGRPIALRIQETLARYSDSANQSASALLQHFANDLRLALDLRPGGGALVISLEDGLLYDRYDRHQPGLSSALDPGTLDNLRHTPTLRVLWKFLPRTAVLLEARGVLTSYPGDSAEDGLTNTPTNILLTQLGFMGAVTPRVNVTMKAGYGDTLLDGRDNFRSLIGQAEASYEVTSSAKVTGGYVRQVEPVSFFKYFTAHRYYLRYEQTVLGRTLVSTAVSYDMQRYGVAVAAASSRRREDGNLIAGATIEHRLQDWLTLSLVEQLNWRTSSYLITAEQDAGYFFNDVFLRATVHLDGVAALLAL